MDTLNNSAKTITQLMHVSRKKRNLCFFLFFSFFSQKVSCHERTYLCGRLHSEVQNLPADHSHLFECKFQQIFVSYQQRVCYFGKQRGLSLKNFFKKRKINTLELIFAPSNLSSTYICWIKTKQAKTDNLDVLQISCLVIDLSNEPFCKKDRLVSGDSAWVQSNEKW